MKAFLIIISLFIYICNSFSQTYKPDYYGFVADKKFHAEIKLRNYSLVSSFDTFYNDTAIVYATVIKNDSLKWIDLNLKEFDYEYSYDEFPILFNFDDYLNSKKLLSGQGLWILDIVRSKKIITNDTVSKLIFDKPSNPISSKWSKNYFAYSVNKKWGLVDSTGRILLRARYKNISTPRNFHGIRNYLTLTDTNNKVWIYNITQNKISNNYYNSVKYCKFDNVFIVENGTSEFPNFSLVDTNFNELVTGNFVKVFDFSNNGYFILQIKDSITNYSIVNLTGTVIAENLGHVGGIHDPYINNKFYVEVKKIKDSTVSLLNLHIPNMFTYFPGSNNCRYLNEFGVVKIFTKSEKEILIGLANINGLTIIEPNNYSEIEFLTQNKFLLRQSYKYYLFDKLTRSKDKIIYEVLNPGNKVNPLTIVKNENGLVGAIDENNSIVIPFSKDVLIKHGRYFYTNKGVINMHGDLVLKFTFNRQNLKSNYFKSRTMQGVFEKDLNVLIDRYNNIYKFDNKITCKY